MWRSLRALKRREWFLLIAGSAILAFGLSQIHAHAGVTEGGVLGMTLLLRHWLGVSPAVSGLIMNAACYLFGWRTLGRGFIARSIVAGGGFSLFYAGFERIQPLWPELSSHPLLAAVLGAVFVGVGVGLCVRAGGAPSGDDALAMSLSKRMKTGIERIYLISDLTVLALSVSYLPLRQIGCSMITVVLSGQIIGWIQKIKKKTTGPA